MATGRALHLRLMLGGIRAGNEGILIQAPPSTHERRPPESNRCKRLCRPLRSHSARAPSWLIRSRLLNELGRMGAGQLKASGAMRAGAVGAEKDFSFGASRRLSKGFTRL